MTAFAIFMAWLMAMISFMGSGSGGHNDNNQKNHQATKPPISKPLALVIDNKVKGQGEQPKKPTIPTPALLPGLIGLGVATFRKRKAEKDEANV